MSVVYGFLTVLAFSFRDSFNARFYFSFECFQGILWVWRHFSWLTVPRWYRWVLGARSHSFDTSSWVLRYNSSRDFKRIANNTTVSNTMRLSDELDVVTIPPPAPLMWQRMFIRARAHSVVAFLQAILRLSSSKLAFVLVSILRLSTTDADAQRSLQSPAWSQPAWWLAGRDNCQGDWRQVGLPVFDVRLL